MTTTHMGNTTTYSYTPDGLSGIVRYDSRTSTYTPYSVETDHLGSITAMYNNSGTKVLAATYDAWGKRMQTTSTLEFRRGYTGHEHIDGFDLINMNSAIEREHGEFYSPVPSVSRMGEANGRVYDPLIGRFLSPDPFIQLPDFSQNFNRYSYCLNNPLKYTDPSGESIIGAVITGALLGTYMGGVFSNEGEKNPFDWNYKSLDTWCYMACGLYVGAMSGAAGGYVACSGIPFANTASMIASSLVYSVGTWGYTGAATDISINFGPKSIKDCLWFKRGVNNWIFKNSNEMWTQAKDVPGNRLFPLVVKHVNMKIINKYSNILNSTPGPYNLFLRNCSMVTARIYTMSGVPVIGFHPYLLHLQIAGGLRSYMFNYIYTN